MARPSIHICLISCLLSASAVFAASSDETTTAASGSVFYNGIRTQDEIVLVNVRPLGCSTDPNRIADELEVEEYQLEDEQGTRSWHQVKLADVVASSNPQVPMIVQVHGNQVTNGLAKQRGLNLYRRLVRQANDDRPIRYVIFSWPSSKIQGPLKDARVKATRTRTVGWELAWVLDQFPAQTHIGLVGYSYGARIITGALHVLGGGTLSGLSLDERQNPDHAPVRVVLMASALNSDWLAAGHYHGNAMSQVDAMLLLNNSEDPAMRFYRFSTTSGSPQALGLCGPTCRDEQSSHITSRNLANYVGSQHDENRYECAPGVANQAWQYLSFESL